MASFPPSDCFSASHRRAIVRSLMGRVTAETVEHVAGLARLSLTTDERDSLARELDQILEYAASVQSLDTSGVPPMGPTPGDAALRPDTPTDSLPHDAALGSAPDPSDGLFRVPRVIAP
jgi:aspartyl-tRNA(Asn)/glutamyl-tRNA(Gln) amidotransferase subunit C